MEEIANHVILESRYPGVVLGALSFERGLVLVDAPLRMEDQFAWRKALQGLGTGSDHLLVMLDTHMDRAIGVRGMETGVLAHENCVEILRSRPTSARLQEIDAGADWEPFEVPTNIRWPVPEMTYTGELALYWGEEPILLTHRAGAHIAGSWLQYDTEKVVFVGDSVVVHQPPFLAWADLDLWIAELELLQSEVYQGYKIISGRNGWVRQRSLPKMQEFLKEAKISVERMASADEPLTVIQDEVPRLLKLLSFNKSLTQLFHNRLAWGLEQYYQNHYLSSEEGTEGEH